MGVKGEAIESAPYQGFGKDTLQFRRVGTSVRPSATKKTGSRALGQFVHSDGKNIVTVTETTLDKCLYFSYIAFRISLGRDVSGCDPTYGASAVPAGGLANRTRAVSGIMQAGITTGRWGAATGLGQARAGNARTNCVRCCPRKGDRYRSAFSPRPRKPGLKSQLGME